MFLCDRCHDPQRHVGLFRSRGKCESCWKVADCIDCHDYHCEPQKLPTKKEVSK
jgi:hypothetical protein